MEKLEQTKIFDLIPESWKWKSSVPDVFVCVYKAFVGNPEVVKKMAYAFRESEAVSIVLYNSFSGGVLKCVDFQDDRINLQFDQRTFSNSHYLFVFTPTTREGNELLESDLMGTIDSAVGMLKCLFGRNIAYAKVHEYFHSPSKNEDRVVSPAFSNPRFWGFPIVDESTYTEAGKIFDLVAKLDTISRSKLDLSLRWFEESHRSDGIDAFLKLWIALEVIAMPKSNDIMYIKRKLAAIHCQNMKYVNHRFMVGELFGLRSDIAHNGFKGAIPFEFFLYCDSLYVDFFLDFISAPPKFNAEKLLEDNWSKLRTFFSQSRK